MDHCILRTPLFSPRQWSLTSARYSRTQRTKAKRKAEKTAVHGGSRRSERAKEQYRNCRGITRRRPAARASASICRYLPRVRYYRTWNALARLSSTCRPSFVIVTVYGVRSLATDASLIVPRISRANPSVFLSLDPPVLSRVIVPFNILRFIHSTCFHLPGAFVCFPRT